MRPRTGRLKSAARPPSARPAAPRLKEKNEIPIEEVVQQRPTTGKVANVIVDDGIQDDDADEFLVEEKPKDNLDLDTENTSVDVNVSHIKENQLIKLTFHKFANSRPGYLLFNFQPFWPQVTLNFPFFSAIFDNTQLLLQVVVLILGKGDKPFDHTRVTKISSVRCYHCTTKAWIAGCFFNKETF